MTTTETMTTPQKIRAAFAEALRGSSSIEEAVVTATHNFADGMAPEIPRTPEAQRDWEIARYVALKEIATAVAEAALWTDLMAKKYAR